MNRGWSTALGNFKQYLPVAKDWVVAFERPFHTRILSELIPHLGSCELLCLGEDSPSRVENLGRRHRDDPRWAFLEFAVCDDQVTHHGIDYRDALMAYSGWSPLRIRLLFDVTDSNFRVLFSEDPRLVERRCRRLLRSLANARQLVFVDFGPSKVTMNFEAEQWRAYTGLERDDYMLPSGEVTCEPTSVNGKLDVAGWLVGTIPFAAKYGTIMPGSLTLKFRDGEIVKVGGRKRSLCKDLDMTLDRIPGLRYVSEIGLGQSKAVSRAASKNAGACLWHERHFGLHLGLGATLSDEPGKRRTPHHLDLVLRTGRVADQSGRAILRW